MSTVGLPMGFKLRNFQDPLYGQSLYYRLHIMCRGGVKLDWEVEYYQKER